MDSKRPPTQKVSLVMLQLRIGSGVQKIWGPLLPTESCRVSVGHLFSLSGIPFSYLGIGIIHLVLFLGWPQRSETRVFGAYSGEHMKSLGPGAGELFGG